LSNLFFSNADYYKNEKFQKLMRSWNRYLTSDQDDEELLTMWEELLITDFYKSAKEWLKHNYDEDEWKETLE
tara:strand:- start:3293 stop:3508 length:216 start_codon:yes stop_codon:yes gene_type:complete